jgi:hypothetical protein
LVIRSLPALCVLRRSSCKNNENKFGNGETTTVYLPPASKSETGLVEKFFDIMQQRTGKLF